MMVRIWERLENKIIQQYELTENEWVQVDVSKRKKIHVTLVTDQYVSKESLKSLLEEEIKQSGQEYQIGFIDIYSVKQSEEVHLTKQQKKSGYYEWADAVCPGNESTIKCEEELQVISFYSYKGGVGRTIALLETAYLMAAEGKRILILDLDIEAPSLHNIFSDQISDKELGVKSGMIQYLYETVVQKKKSYNIEDIFCPLRLEGVSGEIFLIPAVKCIDSEYIYQIGQIQTQQIQEQDVFGKLFAELADKLHLDAVFIDTRAGFNPWGSLSLLELSNQVIFLAYPNAENIEGLNTAFELVKNAGNTRYAVAVSQIVASDEGKAKADTLFQSLHTEQERPISVYYNQRIALSNCYPITAEGVLAEYKELSDYLLDYERMKRNQKILSGERKRKMLKDVFLQNTEQIVVKNLILFIASEGNMILKYHYLHGLKNGWFPYCSIHAGNRCSIPYFLMIGNHCAECADLLEMQDVSEDWLAVKLIELLAGSCDAIDNFAGKIKTCDSADIQQLSGMLSDKIICKDRMSGKENVIFDKGIVLIILIDLTELLLDQSTEYMMQNVKKLLKYNASKDRIQFKFTVSATVLEKQQGMFQGMKGYIRELRVEKDDLQRFLIRNIDKDMIVSLFDQSDLMGQWDNEMERHSQLDKDVLEILLGIRKSTVTYSQYVLDYLYQFVQKHPQYEYERILECLKIAAKKELTGEDEHDDDRLISFHRIREELAKEIHFFECLTRT